jgi:hypothetical protein
MPGPGDMPEKMFDLMGDFMPRMMVEMMPT